MSDYWKAVNSLYGSGSNGLTNDILLTERMQCILIMQSLEMKDMLSQLSKDQLIDRHPTEITVVIQTLKAGSKRNLDLGVNPT